MKQTTLLNILKMKRSHINVLVFLFIIGMLYLFSVYIPYKQSHQKRKPIDTAEIEKRAWSVVNP